MRKWTMVGTVLAMGLLFGVSGGANSASETTEVTWNAQTFIRLEFDNPAVDLGTISGDLYNPEAESWDDLESTGHGGWVLSNNPGGFTLTVTAENANGYQEADLSRFFITGWNTPWQALDGEVPLGTRAGAGRENIDNIGYRYEPSFDDEPGDYQVIVKFTATTAD